VRDSGPFCTKGFASTRELQTSRVTTLLSLCCPSRLKWFSTVWMTLYYYCISSTELSPRARSSKTIRTKTSFPCQDKQHLEPPFLLSRRNQNFQVTLISPNSTAIYDDDDKNNNNSIPLSVRLSRARDYVRQTLKIYIL
jgi:hypothetical protein